MSDQFINCTAKVPVDVREKAADLLAEKGLTVAEIMRLAVVFVAETGRLPFDVPERLRGLKKPHGAAKRVADRKTFFD